MDYKRQAAAILAHYLKTAFKAAGLPWTGDNQAEIETVVDFLVLAARERAPLDNDYMAEYNQAKEAGRRYLAAESGDNAESK